MAPISAATPSGIRVLNQAVSGCVGPSTARDTPGPIQSATVIANAVSTDFCPVVHGPRRLRSSATKRRTPSNRSTPAENMRLSSTTVNAVRTVTTGMPTRHHSKKEMSTPSCWRIKPRPIRFGAVPIGVASPPMEAENAMHR